jgi:hypothetical protein
MVFFMANLEGTCGVVMGEFCHENYTKDHRQVIHFKIMILFLANVHAAELRQPRPEKAMNSQPNPADWIGTNTSEMMPSFSQSHHSFGTGGPTLHAIIFTSDHPLMGTPP